MNKGTIGLLLAVLVAGVAFYYIRGRAGESGDAKYPAREFAVASEDEIGRIFIADMTGRTMDLRLRPTGEWYIGDSVKASPTIMKQATSTLTQLRIDHIPPQATQAAVLETMAATALKVEVYDKEGGKLRSLLIGNGSPKGAGSYMTVEGYDEVFVVRRGLLSGILRPLFDLRNVGSWRSLEFIAFDPQDIQSVEVRYPRQASESFRVVRAGDSLRLDPLTELVGKRAEQPQQRRLESYLEVYASIPLATYVEDSPSRDSISGMVPFAQILVERTGERRDTFELQPSLLLNERGAPDASLPFSNYWVEHGKRGFVVVQDHQINPALMRYSSFF